MIIIEAHNLYCQINNLDEYTLRDVIDKNLSYYVQGYMFTKAYQKGFWNHKKQTWEKWDGRKHLLDNKNRFPTGLLERVIKILNKQHADYKIIDKRKEIKFKKKIKTQNIEHRPYQKEALKLSLKNKGGIVKAATGSGKSIMIAELIASTNVKTMVYVIGIDLLHQTAEILENTLGLKIGIIGDGKVDIRKINICTVWTAASALGKKYYPYDDEDQSIKEKQINNKQKAKIAGVIYDTEMAIYDECHMLGAKTLQIIASASKSAYYKFGYSGTPFREDNADLLLEAVCGSTIVDISASELIKQDYLVQPKINFVTIPEHHETLPRNYHSVYSKYITDNKIRNNKIVKIARKLIKDKRKVLILVKTIKHGKIILSELEKDFVVYFVDGNLDSSTRNWIREEFTNNRIDIIVASVVYDTGINLPNLDALILAGSGKSLGRALQRLGRVIRKYKDKKDAVVVDFIDQAPYLLEHTKSRINTYRTEPEFKIILPKNLRGKNGESKTKKKKKSKSVQRKKQY